MLHRIRTAIYGDETEVPGDEYEVDFLVTETTSLEPLLGVERKITISATHLGGHLELFLDGKLVGQLWPVGDTVIFKRA